MGDESSFILLIKFNVAATAMKFFVFRSTFFTSTSNYVDTVAINDDKSQVYIQTLSYATTKSSLNFAIKGKNKFWVLIIRFVA